MFDFLKKILGDESNSDSSKSVTESDRIQKVQVATCAVLLEVAKADNNFTEVEKNKIFKIIKNTFRISDQYISELMELAESKIEKSVSMYEFTNKINNYFSQEEKFEILINLWKLVLVDGSIDPQEDHLIKKVGSNFNFHRKEIVDAKLIAKQEMEK